MYVSDMSKTAGADTMISSGMFSNSADGLIQEFALITAVLGTAAALLVWGLRAAWRAIQRRNLVANSDKEK